MNSCRPRPVIALSDSAIPSLKTLWWTMLLLIETPVYNSVELFMIRLLPISPAMSPAGPCPSPYSTCPLEAPPDSLPFHWAFAHAVLLPLLVRVSVPHPHPPPPLKSRLQVIIQLSLSPQTRPGPSGWVGHRGTCPQSTWLTASVHSAFSCYGCTAL